MAKIPVITLSDGFAIPKLGYGTGTAWFKRGEDSNSMTRPLNTQLVEATLAALRAGFRHIDTAEMYGTEREVGEAIAVYLKETGLPRSALFVTTKVYQNVSNVTKACEESLQRLSLDYVDLYLIHAPFRPEMQLDKAWQEMEAIRDSGKARSIGVSNFRTSDLTSLMAIARIKPVVNQIEAHPYLRQPRLLEYCKEHNILIEAYSPLLSLTTKKDGPVDAVVQDIATATGLTTGQVLLQWSVSKGYIPITTTSSAERLQQYLEAVDEQSRSKISDDQVAAITAAGASAPFRKFWVKEYEGCTD